MRQVQGIGGGARRGKCIFAKHQNRIIMRKKFNITGSCNPEWHYMVDTAERFAAIKELIDYGGYFTINRARQYGKTTMLRMIWRKLSDRYLIIDTSFEGVGDSAFESEVSFSKLFARLVQRALPPAKENDGYRAFWEEVGKRECHMDALGICITQFCQSSPRPVLLMIDEVDQSSNNRLFVRFIGMLRELYLLRDKNGMNSTFYSVILAGVYDVKNLKLRLRPDEERKYNSPWNIAADFNVDMTFHPEEIAQMLGDYEADTHTGMDIPAVSGEIYRYTSGYPFLVSYICKYMDEQCSRQWNAGNILQAVKHIVQGGSTLMDDLQKNLENYAEFKEFMYQVTINGEEYAFSLLNPMVNMGNMFSYIQNRGGRVAVHNLIFEEALYLYFTLDYAMKNAGRPGPTPSSYIVDGKLMMEYVLTRFRDLMREEYRKEDGKFLERQGRLVFLSFLKPVINGTGFYYVEPQTRDNRRMDLVVTYGGEEFIVELKIWRGEKYERQGRDQLSEYLDIRGRDEGYLVTFDLSNNKQDNEPQWIQWNGKRIFEVVL